MILQKKCVPLMLLIACRAAGRCLNIPTNNIEMEIKEKALMTSGLKIT
jgi:hypothetical protein